MRYMDGLGRKAVAIRDRYGSGWKLTFVGRYTRKCRSVQHLRTVLDANGNEWRRL